MPEFIIGMVQPAPLLPVGFFEQNFGEINEFGSCVELDIHARCVDCNMDEGQILVKLFSRLSECDRLLKLPVSKVISVHDENGRRIFLNPLYCETCKDNSGCLVKEVGRRDVYLPQFGGFFTKVRCLSCEADWVYISIDDD